MIYLFYILFGYLSGSVIYAWLIPKYICGIDTTQLSDDNNPGAFNAFKYAGTSVGILVIILELAKGFIPVFFATKALDTGHLLFALVLAAPVIGHAFPLFQIKKGGKAIAASFGCLLGLFPNILPVAILAAFYLLFSLIIIIQPHLLRTIITFVCLSAGSILTVNETSIIIGTVIISSVVILKHIMKYEKEPVSIRFLRSRNR